MKIIVFSTPSARRSVCLSAPSGLTPCEDDVGVLTLSSRARNGLSDRKTLREDDVGVLTLSSRAGKGRNDRKTLREDDVGALTLSSRARKGRNDRKTLREDDVGVLTLSSRAGKGRNGDKTVREDDVGVLTLSSRARKGLSGCKTLSEDDEGVLTLSSRAGKGRIGSLVAQVPRSFGAGSWRLWRRSDKEVGACATKRLPVHPCGAGPLPKNRPAPQIVGTCANPSCFSRGAKGRSHLAAGYRGRGC